MTGIQLGLTRIFKLVEHLPIPWKAIHVAGTNGKGSVCNYTYRLLLSSGIRCGMFTSPHLIDRWDCISLNGSPVSKELFNTIETRVKARNDELKTDATSFEILTATAFEAFTDSKLEVAVIETGVGGLEDATNIIRKPTPAVITKLGLDHEDLLGKGIQSIVDHKAGIMKHGSPCLIDGTNSADVLIMLEEKAKARNARPYKICNASEYDKRSLFSELPGWSNLAAHKRMHLILAYESAKMAIQSLKKPEPEWEDIMPAVSNLTFPGRQQSISIQVLTGRLAPVLLDGCHNEQSALVLEQTVAERYRASQEKNGVCWILAASKSKDIQNIFRHLVKEDDDVVVTEFGPVDGMPWIKPMQADQIVATLQTNQPNSSTIARNVLDALQQATVLAKKKPLVIAGSLYLVSDVLRLLRDSRAAI